MRKKVIIIMTTVLLTMGAVTAAYAKGIYNSSNFTFAGTMMDQSNGANDAYTNMINLMRENGFGTAARAMENGDISTMDQFMSNLTDEQYNEMIDIMENSGYGNMSTMMQSVNRGEMVNIHNSMMGR